MTCTVGFGDEKGSVNGDEYIFFKIMPTGLAYTQKAKLRRQHDIGMNERQMVRVLSVRGRVTLSISKDLELQHVRAHSEPEDLKSTVKAMSLKLFTSTKQISTENEARILRYNKGDEAHPSYACRIAHDSAIGTAHSQLVGGQEYGIEQYLEPESGSIMTSN
ncbi:hypothetical protein BJ508DRAFT_313228 [Ascobolus immersus RN42]|uniref:Uncharacterized protein n=1 Tax=Ascobolus immersus RN42 TaxID=1160509 RepID=A0A3N4HJR7_ASCIM|nr:hypothetical protein BJ508DRAFT_313228 [Ascobolus immersus RN42]